MNDAQRRYLLAIFRQIDELLAEANGRLDAGTAERLFPPCAADATPIQQKHTADYARRLHSALRESLARLAIDVPPPGTSGIWLARTLLMKAQVAVAGLEPHKMTGHGPLADHDARELRAVAAELSNGLDQMEAYLAQGPGEAMAARLQRIGVAGADANTLAELERIVSAHGLVGFRPALEQLADRLAAPGLEVAVFGRVKAGKSSLLNFLLDTAVLPVGVTPVTEIPVRIVYGPAPLGHAEFTDAAAQAFALARLAEFVSVQQNPGNIRYVARLAVELPAPLLRDGIALVDTPGGGLAAAETTAYLPRCDLGLVLVDAAATLADADVALVDALRHAGAEVQVLLGKADLLGGQDLERALDFIRRRLAGQLGADIPVYPVSIKEGAAVLAERWLESALRPRLVDGRRLAGEASARKFALLRDAVRATLAGRLAATEGGSAAPDAARQGALGRLLMEVLARLDEARRTAPKEITDLCEQADMALDEAAHNAAVIWNENRTREFDATTFVEASAQARAGIAASSAARQLADLRAVARATLAEAKHTATEDLPRASDLPVMDSSAVLPPSVAHRPAGLGFAGEAALRLALRHGMREAGMDTHLADAFRNHAHRLDAWRQMALDALKAAFLARWHLVAEEAGKDPETGSDIARDIRTLDAMGLTT